jgi:hypothetical protein
MDVARHILCGDLQGALLIRATHRQPPRLVLESYGILRSWKLVACPSGPGAIRLAVAEVLRAGMIDAR